MGYAHWRLGRIFAPCLAPPTSFNAWDRTKMPAESLSTPMRIIFPRSGALCFFPSPRLALIPFVYKCSFLAHHNRRLFGFFFDTWVLSTGFAAVRRWTGISVKDMVVPRLKNPNVQTFASGYFNVGEFSLNKGLEWAGRMSARDGTKPITGDVREVERLALEIKQKQKQLEEALKESERRAGKL